MKPAARCFCILAITLIAASLANAQCSTVCLMSFTLSPTTATGDGSDMVTGTAVVYEPPSSPPPSYLAIWIQSSFSTTKGTCIGGHPFSGNPGGCDYPAQNGYNTVQFEFAPINSTSNTINGTVTVQANYPLPGITDNLTILPVPNIQEPPPNDPDTGPCPHCSLNGTPSGGQPINFANGNTWITQHDYSIPGLGGGLKLTRSWNSLWSLANPPEEIGIFGDSWRSNFEERIQALTGGVVKYWKADGSSLFYSYNSLSGAYSLTAPIDDQTALSFDSINSRWIVVEKNGTQRFFNNAGYLTAIVDANGNTITINVDANNQNRIASVVDAIGRVLTFNYANGSLPRLCTSISDAVGTVATYTYYTDGSGRLQQVAYADGSQFNFQYNSSSSNTLISSVVDSLGKTIEVHTYDSQRRGLTTQQANDSSGRPVNQVTVHYYPYYAAQANQGYVNDSLGNGGYITFRNVAQSHYLIAATLSCASCSYVHDTQIGLSQTGYKTVYTDGNGQSSYYSYDSQGNMASKSLPTGNPSTNVTGYNTWNYTYNSFGEVLTATDPLGSQPGDPNHTTTNTYDPQGNLLSVTTPSPDGGTTPGSVTQFAYNSNGTLKTITDPLNNVTTISYCPTGLSNCPAWMIQSIQDANGKVTSYTYDARGNRLTIQDPVNGSANPTTFTYDVMNRVTAITYPGATTSVEFHYDYRGRRDYVIDQNGNKTTYAYDDADRLISVTDAQSPTAGVTRYAYDTENNLTDIYDASNNHTHFAYTYRHMLQQTTFPSGYYETYTYDSNDNLRSKTDRNGHQTTYTYDYQNRMATKQYADYTSVTYTYDAAGQLTQVADPTGTYTFGFDNMGRLTSATTNYKFTTFGNKTVQYGYDAASNRASMTDPQSLPTTYGYDKLNRLTGLIFNNQAPGFTFGYDDLSRRNLLTRPNGINTTYGYDPGSHLLSVLHQQGSTVLDGATYTYDNAGNRLTRTDQRTGTSLSYGYDNIYQLLSATQGSTTTESYTYDIVGNRLSSLGVSPYTYNSSNELMSLPSGSYTYDKNGNTTVKPDGTQYSWDYENRLTQVVLPSSGGTATFKYDPFGRRIQKAFTQGSTTTTTNHLYDGMNVLEELDNSGNVLARYTQSGLIDEQLGLLRSGVTAYYQADGLGSTGSLSNSAGTLANTYTYDSFGRLTASTGTLVNPFQYTGREFDPETGIYEYRARYYDPSVGRFISEDPIAFRGGVNFYRYVLNNPIINIDPPGLGPNGWGNKSWTWTQRANCFISYYACGAGLGETRQSLDQMTDDAVTNTSDAMGSQGGYSNQRLKCGLSQDQNCRDALNRCIKLALTNPFPPPWWLKWLISSSGGK